MTYPAKSHGRASYDVHTHVGLDQAFWLSGWWPYAATAQDLLVRMDTGNLDRAVCFPFGIPSAFDTYVYADRQELALLEGRFPFDLENAALLKEVERTGGKDRLLPFAMFDPMRCVDQQLESLQTMVGQIAGLKTQTTLLQSQIRNLLEGPGQAIMAFAAEHDLPMLFHTSIAPADEWAQVQDCLDIAEAHPNIRFNLAHSLRFDRAGLERAAELPNVWVDCSAHLIHCHLATTDCPAVATPSARVDTDYHNPTRVLEAIHHIMGDRYLWGSDTPYMSWCDDSIAYVCTYKQETDALWALPEAIAASMTRTAPEAWLFGLK